MSSQDILLLTPGRPALYTTTRALVPVLLPTSPTAGDVCKEFKKTEQFVNDLQICCHFTTHNSATALKTNGETNTFPICLFVLSEQLVLILRLRSNCENKIFRKILVPGNANHDSHRFLGADK